MKLIQGFCLFVFFLALIQTFAEHQEKMGLKKNVKLTFLLISDLQRGYSPGLRSSQGISG